MEISDSVVMIFTDGACSYNPGPGGWAVLLLKRDAARFLSGYSPHTTNNKMELFAAITALKTLSRRTVADVYTDSKYVQQGIDKWIHTWRKNDWKTASKKAVLNRDMWIELVDLANMHDVHWNWVQGHSTNRFNNFVDFLARVAILNRSGFDVRFSVQELDNILAQIPFSKSRYELKLAADRVQEAFYGRQIPRND